jgi:membrane protease YdiL (CAAX protease family)
MPPSVILGVSLLAVTLSVRKDPLRDLGIRFDNLKSSGRECVMAFLISTGLILIVFLFHLKDFISYSPQHYYWLFLYPLWGIAQQFCLQSIMFVRFLQILKNKYFAILAAAVIFSFLHSPNISFMILTFIAGLCCCILFSRHRNIFTVGIFHATMAAMAYSLLVPGVFYSFAVGPTPEQWRNNMGFIAHISYEGTTIRAKPSDSITIPIGIENKGTSRWDSNEKNHPVHISYHLMDPEGNMITFDNIRTSFAHPIEPGESRKVDLIVAVPSNPGRYLLEIDLVKERVTWFKDKGSLTIQISLVVSNVRDRPFRTF